MVNFVQVPVPREHVLEIMRWVLFRMDGDAAERARDREQFQAYLAAADEPTRRLLDVVAEATLDGQPLRLRDVADLLEQDNPTTLAIVDAVQHDALDGGREALETWVETAVGLEGRKGSHVFVAMRDDLARLARTRPSDGGR